jgi:putative flippase GtrA
VEELLKNNAEKIRFVIIGGLNTAIDFGILFALVTLGLPTVASNFVSTSVAMVFSFFANKSFTFQDTSKNTTKRIAIFLIITIFGMWVIQPIIIELIKMALSPSVTNKYIVLLIGKILATIASLTWNYLMYRKFVFIKKP